MPQLPQINRQQSIPDAGFAPRQNVGEAGAGFELASRAAASFADQQAAIESRRQHERDVLDSAKTIADSRLYWTKRSLELEQNAPEGAPDHTAAVQKEFGEWRQKTLEGARPSVRNYLESRLTGLEEHLIGGAMRYEAGSRGRKAARELDGTINTSLNAVYTDPGQLNAVLGDLGATINATGALPEEVRGELLAKTRQRGVRAAYSGMIDRGQASAVLKDLQAGTWSAWMTPELTNQLSDQAHRAVDRQRAEGERISRERESRARASIVGGLTDDLVAAETIGQGPGQGGAWLVSDDALRAAYKSDPAVAEEAIANRNRKVAYAQTRQRVALTSPAEDAALLAAKPAGENFKEQLREYGQVAKAIETKRQALAQSPADYVTQISPQVRDAFTNAGDDPAKLSQAVELSLQAQAQLGVPEHRRQAIGTQQAANLVERVMGLPDEQRAQAFDGLAQQYGRHWPGVYREMVGQKLPPTMQALATTTNPRARVDLVRAATTGEKALKEGVASTDRNDIDKELLELMAPLRKSLQFAPNGTEVGNTRQEAVTLLAYQYRLQGRGVREAARDAFAAVLGDRYDFADTSTIVARMPTGRGSEVRRAADLVARTLDPAELAAPAARPGEKLTDDERRDAYAQTLRAGRYVWANNENDTGLVLLDAARNPVRRTDGKRVELDFSNMPDESALIERNNALLNNRRAAAAESGGALRLADIFRQMFSAPSDGLTFQQRMQRAVNSAPASILPGKLTEGVDVLGSLFPRGVPKNEGELRSRLLEMSRQRGEPAPAFLTGDE
jgi:hypothetical protein